MAGHCLGYHTPAPPILTAQASGFRRVHGGPVKKSPTQTVSDLKGVESRFEKLSCA